LRAQVKRDDGLLAICQQFAKLFSIVPEAGGKMSRAIFLGENNNQIPRRGF